MEFIIAEQERALVAFHSWFKKNKDLLKTIPVSQLPTEDI